ncbi:MAG: PLDc N-terminal domain-containing protein [Bacteroidetes bacterium]|nr:PLDc N-terminal domain-containing protein [Bacteroidota bacterium]MBS1591073.1 PLDc N-terminal domain-containing protein [Bacteroidota bacterium]
MNHKLFYTIYIIGVISTIVGALFKIMHKPDADFFIEVGLLLTAIYTVIALYEIFNSKNILQNEKLMWLVGFIFVNAITGLMYFLQGRKRILRK